MLDIQSCSKKLDDLQFLIVFAGFPALLEWVMEMIGDYFPGVFNAIIQYMNQNSRKYCTILYLQCAKLTFLESVFSIVSISQTSLLMPSLIV